MGENSDSLHDESLLHDLEEGNKINGDTTDRKNQSKTRIQQKGSDIICNAKMFDRGYLKQEEKIVNEILKYISRKHIAEANTLMW